MEGERYAFVTEWYDSLAGIMRRYNFLFYPKDNSVEMIDLKNKRIFLKRTKEESVRLDQCYIGSSINLHGRQLKITEYADNFTKVALSMTKEKTLAIVKPDAMPKMREFLCGGYFQPYMADFIDKLWRALLLEIICNDGFQICEAKSVVLSRGEAEQFYQEHRGKPFFSTLVSFMTEGPCLVLVLLADDGVAKWRNLLGPTSSADARSQAPDSLRARFGTDQTRNACHGSDSTASAQREMDFFFGKSKTQRTSARLENSTLCVVKPHAIMRGLLGRITRSIVEGGFNITALQLFHLEKTNAEEFLEVYKGVAAEYVEMVSELCSGPCVAMAIAHQDGASVEQFRQIAGPMDPEVARHLRPKTLRAMYGHNKLKNAVHCTDLADDGILEVEYFFSILQNSSL